MSQQLHRCHPWLKSYPPPAVQKDVSDSPMHGDMFTSRYLMLTLPSFVGVMLLEVTAWRLSRFAAQSSAHLLNTITVTALLYVQLCVGKTTQSGMPHELCEPLHASERLRVCEGPQASRVVDGCWVSISRQGHTTSDVASDKACPSAGCTT